MRVGISLIGTPDGFECLNLGALAHSLDIGRSIDLDNSLINILPDTDILAVRRESHRNHFLTYVTYYRFAREIKTSRSGTFYGSSIIFEDCYPTDFSFVFSTLENLANVIQALCIDRSENRFHRHLSDDLLPDLTVAGHNLLDPAEYQEKRVPPSMRLTSSRCFLSLDETVPDYKSFLATVVSRRSRRTHKLSDYCLVYTSKDEAVIKEVELRRGLDVETLASLTSRESEESDQGSESQKLYRPGPETDERQGWQLRNRELQAKERDDELLRDDPRSSSRPVPESAKTETGPDEPSRPAEKTTDSRVLPVSRLIPSERFIQPRPTPFKRKVRKLLETRSNRVVIGLVILGLALAGFLVGRWWRLANDPESGNTLYYSGCVKATHNRDPDIRSKCSPEHVLSLVKRALDDCNAFNDRLIALGNKADTYREQIGQQVKLSLPDTSDEFSREEATRFEVPVDFERSQSCINLILQNDDFSRDGLIPKSSPSPTPTPKEEIATGNRPQSRPSPTATKSATPTPSPSVSPTRSPSVSPSVSPAATSTASPSPGPATTPLGTAKPPQTPTPTPSPNPSQSRSSNQERLLQQSSPQTENTSTGAGVRNAAKKTDSSPVVHRPARKRGKRGGEE